jgi:hypothetical protein
MDREKGNNPLVCLREENNIITTNCDMLTARINLCNSNVKIS